MLKVFTVAFMEARMVGITADTTGATTPVCTRVGSDSETRSVTAPTQAIDLTTTADTTVDLIASVHFTHPMAMEITADTTFNLKSWDVP